MRRTLPRLQGSAARLLMALFVGLFVSLGLAASVSLAQDDVVAEPVKQIKLTEEQVTKFISAQPDLSEVSGKLQEAGDNPDAALKAELDGIAKKHGFSSFSELDDVAANISMVMAGLDAEGNFTDPVEAFTKELDDVKADASIPAEDKERLVKELTNAIKTTPPLAYKENIELVKAHRAEIEKALQ